MASRGGHSKKKARVEQGGSSAPTLQVPMNLDRKRAEWLATVKVISGRFFDCTGMIIYHIKDTFARMGWGPLLTLNGDVYPNLMRIFVKNMTISEDTTEIISHVKGKEIRLNMQILSTIFKVPNEPNRIYYWPNGTWGLADDGSDDRTVLDTICMEQGLNHIRDHDLKRNQKIWNKVLIANIFPRSGNVNQIFPFQAYTLYCLTTGIKLSFPYIFMKYFIDSYNKMRNLPYGLLFSAIFKHFLVNVTNEVKEAPTQEFNTNLLKRMTFGPRNAQEDDDDNEDEGGASGSGAGAGDSQGIGFDSSFMEGLYDQIQEIDINAQERHRAFEERIDARFASMEQRYDTRFTAMEANQTAMMEAQSRLEANQFSLGTSIANIEQMLQQFMFPPPPPQ